MGRTKWRAVVLTAIVAAGLAGGTASAHGPEHESALSAEDFAGLGPSSASGVFGQPLAAAAAGPVPTTVATILSISDFHGRLNPSTFRIDLRGQEFGGAAFLQAYFKQRAALSPTPPFLVTQGDAVGATQPVSNLLGDYPTIDLMNRMGFDADTLGNHNFDNGVAHMRDLARAAEFPYLVTNLEGPGGQPVPWTKPYVIWETGGARIGVIGAINPDAKDLLRPGSLGQLEVTPPAPALNAAAAELRAKGVRTVVALAHLGADPTTAGPNGASGPLIDLARELEGVDVLLGDHTYWQVNQPVVTKAGPPVWVVQSIPNGASFSEIKLTINKLDGETLAVAAHQFLAPEEGVTPDPEIAAVVERYNAQVKPIVDQPVGTSVGTIPQDTANRESSQGNLVADAIRASAGTQIALLNSGAMRAPLTTQSRCSGTNAKGGPCEIRRGDVYGMLPFNNMVASVTVTGTQLKQMLENGVSSAPTPAAKFPQISGFSFRYTPLGTSGSRVRSAALADGTAIRFSDDAQYTLATNDYVVSGGDGYIKFTQGVTYGAYDADALIAYLQAHPNVDPPGPPHDPVPARIVEEVP